ncbi:STAS domain-containing protein [Telmatospirillum siberiense]|uniref:Anti-sigma factor antagonist n=1 Tax=Telmatospirillum siberiense TaxID=382514 RepID=A0A2N3PUV4_9PROT|nr:STAS domain-containing protein [Telmatospirillum siberiense]PKU24181.1 anti-sigma factor antagonist [Telmatospirillum siberiense]
MQSRIQKGGDAVELFLEGRFTFADHESFRHIIEELGADAPPRQCTIDLTEVSYLDSAAVGMLLLMRERFDRSKITLKGGSSSVKELIRIAKLGTLFDIAD